LPRLRLIDPSLRAIAASGYAEDPVMAAPRDHGFQASLTKPYLRRDLAEALARALAAPFDANDG
jgi:CheY-like chemotaxis protein